MNYIQLTPTELITFVVEEVQKAVAKAMANQGLIETETETRSAAAMRQARYRQRVKARALAEKQQAAAASGTKSAPATPLVTSVSHHVTRHVTNVSRHVTNVSKASRETPNETLSNPDPRPGEL